MPDYTAQYGLAKTLDLVVATLAGMAAAQTFLGVSTSDPDKVNLSKARIGMASRGVLWGQFCSWTRTTLSLQPQVILIELIPAEDSQPTGWRENGGFDLMLFHGDTDGDAATDAELRACDEVEGIAKGLRAASNAGTLVLDRLKIEPPAVFAPTAPEALRGHHLSILSASYRKGIAP